MGSLGEPNGHSGLPHKNSSDIHLVLGTPEENLAQTTANSSEWSGALPSVESYLRREAHLANQDLTKDGGLTTWMLVHQPAGSPVRKVLCGCETIRKRAFVRRGGRLEEAVCHGIGSVFCPPANRGMGYAGRMMTELGKRLQTWQADNGKKVLFTVLFSDIGKGFYAARGWKPFPSAHVNLPVNPSAADNFPKVDLLNPRDLPELSQLDEQWMRGRMLGHNLSQDPSRTAVGLWPDLQTLTWHHAREEFVAKELKILKQPKVKGAMIGRPGEKVWCYWTRVWTSPKEEAPPTLHILRLVIEDPFYSDFEAATEEGVEKAKNSKVTMQIAALLAAAQSEAAAWGMKQVEIWNPTSTTLAAARLLDPNAGVQHRDQASIASLMWYGEGAEQVDWVCNEKYGWC